MNKSYSEEINAFRPIDDSFFKVFAKDEKVVKVIVEALLKRSIEIEYSETECFAKNLSGRSVKFDLYVKNKDDVYINIEVEKNKERAIPKRARLHSSSLTTSITYPGQRIEDLQETYVVFMTERKVLQENQFMQAVDKTIGSCSTHFVDGEHIIYIDCSKADNSSIGLIAHDMLCNNSTDMYNPILKERTRYLKETEEGIKEMCEVMDRFAVKVKMEEKHDTAIRLLNKGCSVSFVSEICELNIEEVIKLKKVLIR